MTTRELEKHPPEKRNALLQWVNFVADRVPDPTWRKRLYTGLDELAQRAQEVWPRAQQGKKVQLSITDLGPTFAEVDDFEAWEFVACTGYILLNGEDGPLATASSMRRTIDSLVQRTKGKK